MPEHTYPHTSEEEMAERLAPITDGLTRLSEGAAKIIENLRKKES